ncbi:MAG: hypothetical protein WAO55_13680 [Candidatus Manganitrophaceae bacterium]
MFNPTKTIKKRKEAAPTVILDRSSDRSIGTDWVSEKPSIPEKKAVRTITGFLKKYGLPLLLFVVLTLFFWVLSTFDFTGDR